MKENILLATFDGEFANGSQTYAGNAALHLVTPAGATAISGLVVGIALRYFHCRSEFRCPDPRAFASLRRIEKSWRRRVLATYWDRLKMTARIYKPARTAMQSGQAKTKEWMLDYEPEQPRTVEPLMGWTSSTDMKQEVQIAFDTKEEAIAFCEREGIPYQVFETKPPVRPRISYSDNFAYPRREAWTH